MKGLKLFKHWFLYEVDVFGMPTEENILKAINMFENQIKKEAALDIMKTGALDWSKKLDVSETVESAEKYLKDNNVKVDEYIECGMKRIELIHGASAVVHKDCSKQTVDALNQLVEKTFISGVYCNCKKPIPFHQELDVCEICKKTILKNKIKRNDA